MGLIGTCADAFKWGFAVNIKHIGRWILLVILALIPIVDFIPAGAFLKVLKGEEPELASVGRNFLNGLLLFIIALIYMLIPIIVIAIFTAFGLLPIFTTNEAIGTSVGIIGLAIAIIITVIICLIAIPAEINFARTGKFTKAFALSEIFGMIKSIGWGKYILAIILWIIVTIILSIILFIIFEIIGIIPFIGWIIAIIMALMISVPLFCFELRFWNQLFA